MDRCSRAISEFPGSPFRQTSFGNQPVMKHRLGRGRAGGPRQSRHSASNARRRTPAWDGRGMQARRSSSESLLNEHLNEHP
eukprot:8470510-Pyramimonas_sp.AAC.1